MNITPLALAELLINTDYLRSELDRDNLEAARQAQSEAQSRQISALHEAADHVRIGALVQGGLTLGGAMLSGSSILVQANASTTGGKTTAKLLDEGGSALQATAGPAGEVFGTAPRLHAEARAKSAEQEAEQAGWRMDDAHEHQRRVAEHSDRVLDAVAALVESEHAGKLAILANS